MNQFIFTLLKQLNSDLQSIDLEELDILRKAQKSILCIKKVLSKLRTFIFEFTYLRLYLNANERISHFFLQNKRIFLNLQIIKTTRQL